MILTQHWRRVVMALLALLLFALFVSKFMLAQQVFTGAATPSGPAGGDLSGTYPNPIVVTVGGNPPVVAPVPNSSLANDSITVGGTLCILGSSCNPSTSPTGTAGGDLTGTYPNPTVSKVSGVPVALGVPAALGIVPNTTGGFMTYPEADSPITLTGDVTGTGTTTIPTTIVNKSITINGKTCTLGSSCSVTSPVITLAAIFGNGSGSLQNVTDGAGNAMSWAITGPIVLNIECHFLYQVSVAQPVSMTLVGTGTVTNLSQDLRLFGPVYSNGTSAAVAAFGTNVSVAATATGFQGLDYYASLSYPSGSTTVNLKAFAGSTNLFFAVGGNCRAF